VAAQDPLAQAGLPRWRDRRPHQGFGVDTSHVMNTLAVHLIVHDDFSHIYRAIDSVRANTAIPHEIHVTVNAGSPREIQNLRDTYPAISITTNPIPKGFAANHNSFMRLAETPYVALLNDDIYVHPHALDRLVEYLEAHPVVGLVGPVVKRTNGQTQASAYSDPTLPRMLFKILGLGYFTRQGSFLRHAVQETALAEIFDVESLKPQEYTRSVPVVVGVSMVVRRAAYEQAGLMDEDTLLYGEEFGWHWRLRQHGWQIALVADALITHFNETQDLSGWKLAEHQKSILNYFLLYRPHWQAAVIRASIVLAHAPLALLCLPFNQEWAHSHWQAACVGLTWHRNAALAEPHPDASHTGKVF